MVFECDDDRQRLVTELRRLGARPDVLAWIAETDNDLGVLATALAVPFWDEVLGRLTVPLASSAAVVREPVFSLALHAYLQCWRAEAEQRDLFEAARILARAAQEHLSSIRGRGLD